jgi:hypothetical protein
MATFEEDEISDLAEIIGTNSDVLADRLTYYASVITDSDKTKVLARAAEWAAIDGDFVTAHPNQANGGGEYSPHAHRANIAQRIAKLLQCEDLLTTGGQTRLVRA